MRNTRSNSSFYCLAIPAAVLGVLFAGHASAATIADWTFENNVGQINTVPTGTDSAHLTPAIGSGTALGHHANGSNSATVWSAGIGDPSGTPGTAFESAFWSMDDYWEFDFSSTDTGITLTFEQQSSGSGPRDFKLQTSSDGTNWLDLSGATYSLPLFAWVDEGSYSLPDGTVGVRIVNTSNTSTQGTPITTAGHDWVDDVNITGTPVGAAPEASSLILAGLGGLALLGYRRKPTF